MFRSKHWGKTFFVDSRYPNIRRKLADRRNANSVPYHNRDDDSRLPLHGNRDTAYSEVNLTKSDLRHKE
jgi:hypothetical protein